MQDLGAGPSEQYFMTSSCSVNSVTTFLEKMSYMIQTTCCKRFDNSCYPCKLGLYEYQKTRRIIGIDLYVDVDDM